MIIFITSHFFYHKKNYHIFIKYIIRYFSYDLLIFALINNLSTILKSFVFTPGWSIAFVGYFLQLLSLRVTINSIAQFQLLFWKKRIINIFWIYSSNQYHFLFVENSKNYFEYVKGRNLFFIFLWNFIGEFWLITKRNIFFVISNIQWFIHFIFF